MKLSIRNLGKTYDGRRWAVREVSLEVPSGTILGLIGPNGAGKSTTLRMLATVLGPTEGEVRYDGERPRPDDLTALRRRIGFLGDGHPLYKDMTPAEYLRFFGQCFRLRGRALEDAIARTLQTVDLTPRRNTPARELSKGMRQRLLIGRTLLHDPDLLILDEPADGLDPLGRQDLRTILHKIRDRGATIIVSSHILRELDDLCDAVAILQRGRVAMAGRMDDMAARSDAGLWSFELRFVGDPARVRGVLARHPVLIEGEGTREGRPSIAFQLRGHEDRLGDIVRDLTQADVSVLTLARTANRLEDIYANLSDHRVS